MSRQQLARRCWHAIERLREPSSAAGLAALVALLLPRFAEHAPAIVNLALTVLAAIAALVAIVRGEANGSNGHGG